MKENTNFKSIILLATSSLLFFCLFVICLVLILSGTVTLSICGFAVDSRDCLYIGTTNEIRVYESGECVNRIDPHTSRTYQFTIVEGDTIVLSTSTKVYKMDLNGNILGTEEDHGASVYNQISYKKSRFVSEKGDIYKQSNILGWTEITKNNSETVYHIDALSYTIKIVFILGCIAFFVFGVWFVLRSKRNLEDNNLS